MYYKKGKKNKHNNIKTTIDGITFDSKLEAEFYDYFKYKKEVEILELQPKFILQEKFRYNGKGIRALTYISDFRIRIAGQEFIVDAKGQRTKVFNIKEKLFLKKFGETEKLLVLNTTREFQEYYREHLDPNRKTM